MEGITKYKQGGELATVEQAKDANSTLLDGASISKAYKIAADKARRDGDMRKAGELLAAARAIDEEGVELKLALGRWSAGLHKAKNQHDVCQYPEGTCKTKHDALEAVGISKPTASKYERMASHEDAIRRHVEAGGDLGTNALVNVAKSEIKELRRNEKSARKSFDGLTASMDDCKLFVSDIADGLYEIKDESIDCIICDPPYPREFLDTWFHLGQIAQRVLKDGGSLVAMSGQSHVPEVIRNLCASDLKYHWTGCYLTPGGQSPSIPSKKVNTFWKPLFWFTKGDYSGDFIGDVIKTEANANDKRFHRWGQGLGGFSEIVEKFTNPGDTILDPFLGGGTTCVCSVLMCRKFIGCDIDESCIDVTLSRLEEALYASSE